jgi:hypothetical protein
MNSSLKELIANAKDLTKSEKKALVDEYREICNIKNEGNGRNVCKYTNAEITRFPNQIDMALFNVLAKQMADEKQKQFPLSLTDIVALTIQVEEVLKQYRLEVAEQQKIQEQKEIVKAKIHIAKVQEELQSSLELLHKSMHHAEQLAAEAREAQQRANIAKQASEAAAKAHAAILEKLKDAEQSLELKEKKFSA